MIKEFICQPMPGEGPLYVLSQEMLLELLRLSGVESVTVLSDGAVTGKRDFRKCWKRCGKPEVPRSGWGICEEHSKSRDADPPEGDDQSAPNIVLPDA